MSAVEFLEPMSRPGVLAALGLARFSYYFFEAYEEQLIRALKVREGKADTLLEPWTLTTEQAEALSTPEFPVFLTRHSGYRLPIHSISTPTSLLEEVLPYPFAQMVLCAGTEDVSAFTVFPKGLLWSLRRLVDAFGEVERALASAEFGCLSITGEPVEAHVLTQHLGRRRTLLATVPPSRIENLPELLASRYVQLRLTIDPQPNLISQIDHLVLALQASLPTTPIDSSAPTAPELTL